MSGTPRTDGLTVLAQLGMIPACNIAPAVSDRQLEREIAEVTKQRDALVKAIREHKAAIAFTLSDFDELLYKALEELEEGGAQ